MAENKATQAWLYYERGRAYNNSLVPNQYSLVNTNIEFFAGNQWFNLPDTPAMSRLPKPVFNIIKRVASLFVASLTSSAATISFDELSYKDGANIADDSSNAAEIATAEVRNLFEKFKMDHRIRDALFDGAQTGDYCAHFWWDPNALPYGGAFGSQRGEIQMELVDGINVMFGNPNDCNVERQPYILIVGRDTLENLRAEAAEYRKDRSGVEDSEIMPDSDTYGQAGQGGQRELEADNEDGKALYVYLYTKRCHEETVLDPQTGEPKMEPATDKDGNPVYELDDSRKPILGVDGQPVPKMQQAKRMVTSVHVTKATRSCVIYENIDTGLSRYPIAWGNWERQKNQYHGRALVTGIIPNQIFINSMFAMVMRHMQLVGFPKTVYNAEMIPQWSNELGKAIAVRNAAGVDMRAVATNLTSADVSGQIFNVIDRVVAQTKDCLGATDAQMGNVKPDNTSALMVLQSSAEVPLENTRAGLYEWLEDIGAILLDMMGTYYGQRPLVRDRTFTEPVTGPDGEPMLDPTTGMMMTNNVSKRVLEDFDFRQLKNLWLNIRADVGATTYYSEIAMVQTLDNLRRDGVLEIIDYLERIPDKLIPRKSELIASIKKRMTDQQVQQPVQAMGGAGSGAPAMGGPIDQDKALASLSGNMQAKYESLPKVAQRALSRKAMM